jgi:hypothetical protein
MEVARLPRSSSRCREPFRMGSQYCSPRASLMILGVPADPGNCQRCWALIGFDGSRRVIAVAETSWTGGVERPGTEHGVEQNTRLSPPSYQYGASLSYPGIPCDTSTGWQLLDRLWAELRWLQRQANRLRRSRLHVR